MPDVDPAARADLDLVIDAAREAGDLAMYWLRKGAATWEKSPGNPVTEADIAVNDLIALRLRSERPDYGWMSEETADSLHDRSASRTFVVDPIDGTTAFIKGEPGFSISVARLEGQRSVVGVVFNPMTGELFAAAEGGGATLNGQPITARLTEQVEDCAMIVRPAIQSRLRMSETWPSVRLMPSPPSSIAYRMTLVAGGMWDAMVGLTSTNDWDIAAAAIILAEAGGRATDSEGRAFAFNRDATVHPGVVAAGANLHPLLMDRIRTAGPSA